MNFSGINEAVKTLADLINNMASVALKLIIIGLLIVIEQWVENY
mgnify:CR=1 FL=1